MNWDAIGATGEVLGAMAVVVSLVYLAFQIRQNTRQIDENTKAAQATAFDSSIAHTFRARQAIVESPEVARIYVEGSSDPNSLSPEDQLRYRLIIHNVLLSLWNMQSQSQVGELAAETWNAQQATLSRIIPNPGFRWFWDNYSQEFGASFQRIVAESMTEKNEVT